MVYAPDIWMQTNRQHGHKGITFRKRGTTTITIQASMLPVTMNTKLNSQQGVPVKCDMSTQQMVLLSENLY